LRPPDRPSTIVVGLGNDSCDVSVVFLVGLGVAVLAGSGLDPPLRPCMIKSPRANVDVVVELGTLAGLLGMFTLDETADVVLFATIAARSQSGPLRCLVESAFGGAYMVNLT